jgi:acetyl esterase/lipase
MREYSLELLERLRKVNIIEEDGLEIKIKSIPDDSRKGALDSRVLERTKNKMKIAYSLQEKNQEGIEHISLDEIRSQVGTPNIDLTESEIKVKYRLIKIKDHYINLHIYDSGFKTKDKKAIVFFHGGAFFGGSPKALENQSKLLAEKSGAIIISPDYRLAPENPFPCGVEDCMGTVEWVYDNYEILGIDKNKIAVAGDSAGGNFATVCSLKDNKNIIKLLMIIYACVDLTEVKDTFYNWDYRMYDMLEEHKPYIINRLNRFIELIKIGNELYFLQNGVNSNNSDLSPIKSKNLKDFPKTLIIEGEFDFFRISNDVFAKQLKKVNVDVEVIRYLGMDHGFYDRIGMCPQTEDCIIEMAKAMKNL